MSGGVVTLQNVADYDKPTITIRGSGRENFDRVNRDALLDLRRELECDDYEVRFPQTKAAGTVQNSLEGIGIFLAGSISATLLPLLVTDVYNGVKRWLQTRFTHDNDAFAVYVTIYDPDGKPLKNILAKGVDQIKDMTPTRDDDQS